MFFTFYELSADASIWELFIYFVIHSMMQMLGALALILLTVYAIARQIFLYFNGHEAFGYRVDPRRFSGAAALVAFALTGLAAGIGYWSLLPAENQWVGWTAALPLILVCLFFGYLGVSTMIKSWKRVRLYG